MSFDATLCLNICVPLAQTAYDASKLPPGWKITGSIQPTDFGYFILSDDGETFVVSIRGTEHPEEWLADLDARPVEWLYGGSGHVARGFQNYYSRLRTSLYAGLYAQAQVGYKRLICVCHSLGGAIGQQFIREVALLFQQGKESRILCEPTLYTFESPRPFQADAVAQYNQLVTTHWRIENPMDIVVHAPPTNMGFVAGGSLVQIHPAFSLDVHVNHSFDPSIIAGLRKLVAAIPTLPFGAVPAPTT